MPILRKARDSKKKPRAFRDLPADRWAELLFTLALTAATIASVCIAIWQWSVANGQLTVKSWARESGQVDKWIFCLTTARLAEDQEIR
jgi:hypothetical protein